MDPIAITSAPTRRKKSRRFSWLMAVRRSGPAVGILSITNVLLGAYLPIAHFFLRCLATAQVTCCWDLLPPRDRQGAAPAPDDA